VSLVLSCVSVDGSGVDLECLIGTDSTDLTENERLPTSLGWSKKNGTVTLSDILKAVEHIRNATNLITGDVGEAETKGRDGKRAVRGLHFGGRDL